jgi:acyl carrier protein
MVLREHVREQTVKVLGLARPEDVDINEPLRQLGLDSLMAVELRNLLGKSVERSLPATLTFDHPTVAALVDHLAAVAFAEEMGTPEPRASQETPAAAVEPRPAAAFDEMSDDELAVQLASRIDRLATKGKP